MCCFPSLLLGSSSPLFDCAGLEDREEEGDRKEGKGVTPCLCFSSLFRLLLVLKDYEGREGNESSIFCYSFFVSRVYKGSGRTEGRGGGRSSVCCFSFSFILSSSCDSERLRKEGKKKGQCFRLFLRLIILKDLGEGKGRIKDKREDSFRDRRSPPLLSVYIW